MLGKIKRKIKQIAGPRVYKWALRSNVGAGVYYTFISDRFHREHRAVLAGKKIYDDRNAKGADNKFLLTRSIHRLEKGLLMRPRRSVFGLNYIEPTVIAYGAALEREKKVSGKDDGHLVWARDVLTSYFSVIEHTEKTKELECLFFEMTKNAGTVFSKEEGTEKIPRARSFYEDKNVAYDDFNGLCHRRRSVRWFQDKPVPRELIDKAILSALQAPSACNRQPFTYYIIDDKELLSEVVEMPMGTKGYAHSIQAMIVAVGHLDAYTHERDRHLIYIDTSLANMALMLGLETLGLGSCPINWPDIEEREIRLQKFLGLKLSDRPIMMIGIGYPDREGMIAYSQKNNLAAARKFL